MVMDALAPYKKTKPERNPIQLPPLCHHSTARCAAVSGGWAIGLDTLEARSPAIRASGAVSL